MIIQFIGLPGSGKTTVATRVARALMAVHFNADQVRANINSHLGFTAADRLRQAESMGWLAGTVSRAGLIGLCDFICPTRATREAFAAGAGSPADLVIWMDTIKSGRFADTNRIWEPPAKGEYHLRISDLPVEADEVDEVATSRAVHEVIMLAANKSEELGRNDYMCESARDLG